MIDHLQPKGHESGMFAPDKKIIHPFEEKKNFRPNIFWVLKVEIKKFENDVRLFFLIVSRSKVFTLTSCRRRRRRRRRRHHQHEIKAKN